MKGPVGGAKNVIGETGERFRLSYTEERKRHTSKKKKEEKKE